MTNLFAFCSGAIMLGSWLAGVFFLKFWRRTKDRLFLMFGLAFWLMAVERVVLALLNQAPGEDHFIVYVLRLFAFALITAAVVDKNRLAAK